MPGGGSLPVLSSSIDGGVSNMITTERMLGRDDHAATVILGDDRYDVGRNNYLQMNRTSADVQVLNN